MKLQKHNSQDLRVAQVVCNNSVTILTISETETYPLWN